MRKGRFYLAIAMLLLTKSIGFAQEKWSKDYNGMPWVKNMSQPHEITDGLQNTHIAVWQSHGRYYDQEKATWKWQRPNLFCTTEDLFTQTIVIPYLIPMLQNAGAIVFTPRERDWQKEEIIVDNDQRFVNGSVYTETNNKYAWETAPTKGFAQHEGSYADGENPFEQGSVRMARTTSQKKSSHISYQPYFKETGKYAVYVSYQTLVNSVDDAKYTVYHKGQETTFHVNQQMGGGTWVYLGTFDFDEGSSTFNRVVVSNESKHKGVVTADAVRFGGGMGNIVRGGTISGMPRCLEGARYYAQWAGAPREVYSPNDGANDYNDDYNMRSMMTNWLAGGSVYVPDSTDTGKKVPIEMTLAVHSDAGVNAENGFVGTLTICSTTDKDGRTVYDSGLLRNVSKEYAQTLLNSVYNDLSAKYKNWTARAVWDKNYSETRRPAVPAAIIETLSHQNFKDMTYALDPNFRFTMARAIYKAMLRTVARNHDKGFIVQPLQPNNFHLEFTSKDKVTLRWAPVNDPQESSAKPTSYNIYTAIGEGGFDNGENVRGTSHTVELQPGLLYRFRVTAVNYGGESFPTEELAAVYQPEAKQTVLVVNGFQRLSAPAIIQDEERLGFDLDSDIGVSYGLTAGWAGKQLCFDRTQAGKEGPGALGYSSNELAGQFVAGNDFNYVTTHAEAIMTAKKYNVVSCSKQAVENGSVSLKDYPCMDLALGLECDDGHSLIYYKSFSPSMQEKLRTYTQTGGRLLVSGSYIGSDMKTESEQQFLADVLKVTAAGNERNNPNNSIKGLGMDFQIYRTLNDKHYAVTAPDVLRPIGSAICAMLYSDGQDAGVAYSGQDYRTFTMGFPFESITDEKTRGAIMRGILQYLLK
ncbi:MAG: fibronectin type III domain-containing protein [Prevotella sp.]|nr:fibronectin type III domain-containing protein [Prevotella sp.]